jgi:hypothetical protein
MDSVENVLSPGFPFADIGSILIEIHPASLAGQASGTRSAARLVERPRGREDRIEKVMQTLATFPGRGACPKELLAMGVREYQQTLFKPYRVIYRIIGKRVYAYLIVDGRRDMQALLQRRLLGA